MVEKNLYFDIELTARRIRNYGQNILNAHNINITVEQWLVLKVISEKGKLNQLQIGEILQKDKPTISKMIKSLLEKEYLKKERAQDDQREFLIELSHRGKEFIKDLLPIIESIRLKGLEDLNEREIELTQDILGQIRKRFD